MVQKICVVGAGVVGLSCAVRMKDVLGDSVTVTIIADKFFKETTSHVAAGGIRFDSAPTISGYKGSRQNVGRDVAFISFNEYYAGASRPDAKKAGMHIIEGYSLKYPGVRDKHQELLYREMCKRWYPVPEEELRAIFPLLPKGSEGDFLESVMISPRTYMPWLMQRFIQKGGMVKNAHVNSFDELWPEYDVVFNCTGLRSPALTTDDSVYPVRGQVIRALLPASEKKFTYVNNGTDRPPYYYWTPDGTVLGGTKLERRADMNVLEADHDFIMDVTKKWFPFLNITEEKVVEESVGLRPYRPSIRLELEELRHEGAKKILIHNYGHGSHGVGLSWGCAVVAVEMLTNALLQSKL
ncbi:D-aspartate oxidase-like [Watersipora subatra]|uniref:D-aspartate oxidase-like n=1 Tax=Watersipora subatra TaxID=2589382 RepID=UPI00355ADD70